jgi:hypothetical protein
MSRELLNITVTEEALRRIATTTGEQSRLPNNWFMSW